LAARHPVEVAKATGTLATLSNHRLALCCSVGWMKEEFDVFGVDFHTRGRRMDESIGVLRKMWSGEIVEHHGEFFDFPRLRILPQPGNLPIIVSGPAERVLRRAAFLGDGWMSRMCRPDALAVSIEKLRRFRVEAGRESEPFEILMVAEHPWGLDEVRQAADLGVTEMILLPAYFALKERTPLDEKRRYWEEFANRVIHKASAR
jgi:alkanesulfonate monooxygenase SsuD/methylene tetrahydromethanopterin reductase-like flavin-dependent oxidoreductase (luciferase family)